MFVRFKLMYISSCMYVFYKYKFNKIEICMYTILGMKDNYKLIEINILLPKEEGVRSFLG